MKPKEETPSNKLEDFDMVTWPINLKYTFIWKCFTNTSQNLTTNTPIKGPSKQLEWSSSQYANIELLPKLTELSH